ncbi:hypothetical protein AVEN_204811-1 [Araneus ventricosus]|uniref:Uncharacterized protein n=1 Tax=Araneus ventricosus TaxID=182803 RepID=A0A4Y2K418_ARAVE|nr:hypothetical protein AVEN_204811-1 [Araneus ventricosus]
MTASMLGSELEISSHVSSSELNRFKSLSRKSESLVIAQEKVTVLFSSCSKVLALDKDTLQDREYYEPRTSDPAITSRCLEELWRLYLCNGHLQGYYLMRNTSSGSWNRGFEFLQLYYWQRSSTDEVVNLTMLEQLLDLDTEKVCLQGDEEQEQFCAVVSLIVEL